MFSSTVTTSRQTIKFTHTLTHIHYSSHATYASTKGKLRGAV